MKIIYKSCLLGNFHLQLGNFKPSLATRPDCHKKELPFLVSTKSTILPTNMMPAPRLLDLHQLLSI